MTETKDNMAAEIAGKLDERSLHWMREASEHLDGPSGKPTVHFAIPEKERVALERLGLLPHFSLLLTPLGRSVASHIKG